MHVIYPCLGDNDLSCFLPLLLVDVSGCHEPPDIHDVIYTQLSVVYLRLAGWGWCRNLDSATGGEKESTKK